jgi:hypothetical protein
MARKVAELAAAGPVTAGAGAGAAGPGTGTYPAPPGFVFDPQSGYFLNTEVSVHWLWVAKRCHLFAGPVATSVSPQEGLASVDATAIVDSVFDLCAARHVL